MKKVNYWLKYQEFKTLIILIISSLMGIGFTVKLTNNQSQDNLAYIKTLNYSDLQSGDIIFRRSKGLLSQALFTADSQSEFSHVGMIQIITEKPFVIHSSTGHPLGTNAQVKRESLHSFLQSESTLAVAIYRLKYPDQKIITKVINFADQAVLKTIPFDTNFDLKTPDKLYCTELIWRAYLDGGIDLVDGKFTPLDLPIGKDLFLLPRNLLESRYLKRIYFDTIEESIKP